jgi:hypothetical protein
MSKYKKNNKKSIPHVAGNNECLDEYTLYQACISDNSGLIQYHTDNRNKLPQECLYVYIIQNEINMCRFCINNGCAIDQTCISLACLLNEYELIKYCVESNILPTIEDILNLINKTPDRRSFYNQLDVNDNLIKIYPSLKNDKQAIINKMKELVRDPFNIFEVYNHYGYGNQNDNNNDPSKTFGSLAWYNKKYMKGVDYKDGGGGYRYLTGSNRIKIKRKYNDEKIKCINYILGLDIDISKEIYEAIGKNKIVIKKTSETDDSQNAYITGLLKNTSIDRKTMKEVVAYIKKKGVLSNEISAGIIPTIYDKAKRTIFCDLISNILDIEGLNVTEDLYRKMINFVSTRGNIHNLKFRKIIFPELLLQKAKLLSDVSLYTDIAKIHNIRTNNQIRDDILYMLPSLKTLENNNIIKFINFNYDNNNDNEKIKADNYSDDANDHNNSDIESDINDDSDDFNSDNESIEPIPKKVEKRVTKKVEKKPPKKKDI